MNGYNVLQKSHKQQRDDIRTRHKQQIDQLRERFNRELELLKEQQKQELESLSEQHNQELEEWIETNKKPNRKRRRDESDVEEDDDDAVPKRYRNCPRVRFCIRNGEIVDLPSDETQVASSQPEVETVVPPIQPLQTATETQPQEDNDVTREQRGETVSPAVVSPEVLPAVVDPVASSLPVADDSSSDVANDSGNYSDIWPLDSNVDLTEFMFDPMLDIFLPEG